MSGRYQSKLFNFLWRQSLRLQDQSARTWRNTKVGAVWGVQILLYPIYVVFQTTRLAGKQLQQTVRQTLPRLRAAKQTLQHGARANSMTADQSIHQTLQAIASLDVDLPTALEVLLLPAEANAERELALYVRHHPRTEADSLTVSDSATVQRSETTAPDVTAVRIQAIASSLATRSLVLVTTRNQILDILSPEQQKQLAQRMVWETAAYWRHYRLMGKASESTFLVSRDLSLAKARKNALLPIRAFCQLMAWMQRGSVAVAVDLFRESRLANTSTPLALPDALEPSKSAQPSWMMEAQFYDWLGRIGQSTSTRFINGLEAGFTAFAKLTNQKSPASHQLSAQPDPVALPAAQPDWMALLDQWMSKLPGLQAKPELPPPSSNQPWLTSEDLFGQSNLATESTPASTPISSAQPATKPPAIGTNINTWLKQSLRKILPTNSALSRTEPTTDWELIDTAALETTIKTRLTKPSNPKSNYRETTLTRTPARSLKSISVDPDGIPVAVQSAEPLEDLHSSLDTANAGEAAIMPQSWIETEAQLVGYVKHPLEQLLELIDKGMLWVEERLARLWQWLTHSIE